MPEEKMNKEFRLKKIDEIRNYLIEEMNRNELMSKKHRKICRVFSYNFKRSSEFCNRIKNLYINRRN